MHQKKKSKICKALKNSLFTLLSVPVFIDYFVKPLLSKIALFGILLSLTVESIINNQ